MTARLKKRKKMRQQIQWKQYFEMWKNVRSKTVEMKTSRNKTDAVCVPCT